MNVYDRLLQIIEEKRSRVIFSCDVTSMERLIDLTEICGPYICVLKVHTDIILDFSLEKMLEVQKLSKKHNFLIMEDRKFGDVGHTIYNQISGFFNYKEWANLVTAYPYIGQTGLDAFGRYGIGVFLIAELSINEGEILPYKELYKKNKGFPVCGTIGQNNTGMLQATPGIHFDKSGDNFNQVYKTPEIAREKGADLFIIGRGIYNSKDPLKAIQKYYERTTFF
jgi:uridine monophosphate synthetase